MLTLSTICMLVANVPLTTVTSTTGSQHYFTLAAIKHVGLLPLHHRCSCHGQTFNCPLPHVYTGWLFHDLTATVHLPHSYSLSQTSPASDAANQHAQHERQTPLTAALLARPQLSLLLLLASCLLPIFQCQVGQLLQQVKAVKGCQVPKHHQPRPC